NQILRSDYLDLFERIIKKYRVSPSIIANVFVNTLKDLRKRENIPVERLEDEDFEEVFELLSKRKIVKESIPDILSYKAKNPEMKIGEIVKKLDLEILTKDELLTIIKKIIEKNRDQPVNKIIGIVMSRVRGKARSEDVVNIVKKEMRKIY
ncbi:MAG: Glu-tRNA(Gln) amidotransferase subunit GatE, partial [Candidatus Heimdallarchaeaceae archaeon]